MMWNPQVPFGASALDRVINYNAQVIAYANDFLFMFFISLPALLVIFLMRRPTMAPTPHDLEVME
jgi:DHA2 family multidrug resistance protein